MPMLDYNIYPLIRIEMIKEYGLGSLMDIKQKWTPGG